MPFEARNCHRFWAVRNFGPDVNFAGGTPLKEVRFVEAIRRGVIFIPGVRIPGYLFAVLYLAISYYLDKRGGGNINHGAHMWGAIYGLLFTIAFVTAMGQLNLIDNFKEQLQANNPFIPVGC